MALFPFMLFILNLIPYIPIEGFQEDFLGFVKQSVPPTTYDAIFKIINDILHNSHSGLLSTGFLIAIFLMANGVNAILGGFEYSYHVTEMRNMVRQYLVSMGMAILLSLTLIFTVAVLVYFEIGIENLKSKGWLEDDLFWIEKGQFLFFVLFYILNYI